MKKINYLYLFTLISTAMADYTIQNPPHLGIHWQDVEMINDSSAIAVGYSGDSGVFSRTTDLGHTWDHQYFGGGLWGEIQFNDVEFIDEQNGWVAGTSGNLLRTWNGGNSWLFSEIPTIADLVTLQFVNDQVGYLGANQGWQNYEIYKTTDGGETWEYIYSGNYWINKIDFINENEGWIATAGDGMQHTTDGGQTWWYVQIPEQETMSWQDIDFIDESQGWVVSVDNCNYGSCGWQYRSSDGGQSWVEMVVWLDNYISKIRFLNEMDGYAIEKWSNGMDNDVGSIILNTADGGESWVSQVNLYTMESVQSLNFNPASSVMVVGDNGLSFYKQNNSTEWKRNAYVGWLNTIFFLNENLGWAAGLNGIILKTTDGGNSWEILQMDVEIPQDPFNSQFIKNIQFLSENIGYISCGIYGLKKTIDGGLTWQLMTDENDDIRKVWFTDENNGWVIAYQDNTRKVMHTNDGGNSWIEQLVFNDIQYHLNDFHFLNNEKGWVVGRNTYQQQTDGLIFKTENGGEQWVVDTLTQFLSLHSVDFVNETTGWIIARNSPNISVYSLNKTVDGGQTWTSLFETNWIFPTIEFLDPLNGIVTSNYTNSFHHTNDGGITWQDYEIDHEPDMAFYDIAAVTPFSYWISGKSGLIIKLDVEAGIIPGDANFDGEINVLDVMVIVNIILAVDGTEFEILATDINQDEMINVQDILLIVQIILNEQD